MKLKTVTEIRRSSARDTFVDEGVFELNSLPLGWEPEERLKRGVVWSVLLFFFFFFFFLFFFSSMRRAAQFREWQL